MKRLVTAIKAGFRGWQNPESVVCIQVRAVVGDETTTLHGGRALRYLANRLEMLEESTECVPELVGAAYSEGYKTAVQDWATGQCIPEQREAEYLERNLEFIEGRMEVNRG